MRELYISPVSPLKPPLGVLRYFSVQNALTKGSFPVARFTVGFLALMLIAVVVVVFGILVAAIK